MRRMAWFALLLAPVALAFNVAGCKKAEQPEVKEEPSRYRPGGGSGVSGQAAKGQPLKAAGLDGTITGRIVYDGEPPEMAEIASMKTHKDSAGCLAGKDWEHRQQSWIIGKDKGVANVVVWLDAKGKYFDQLKEEDKDRSKEEVKLDQPHCVFIPHVVALYPSYFDGKAQQPTNQVFKVVNNANFTHNTKWSGKPTKNPPGTVTLPPSDTKVIDLTPTDTITFVCDIHPWMQAKGKVFDHPYHAVTGEDGKFVLKNVPTGVDLTLVFWHEEKGEFKKQEVKLMANQTKDEGDVKVKK